MGVVQGGPPGKGKGVINQTNNIAYISQRELFQVVKDSLGGGGRSLKISDQLAIFRICLFVAIIFTWRKIMSRRKFPFHNTGPSFPIHHFPSKESSHWITSFRKVVQSNVWRLIQSPSTVSHPRGPSGGRGDRRQMGGLRTKVNARNFNTETCTQPLRLQLWRKKPSGIVPVGSFRQRSQSSLWLP